VRILVLVDRFWPEIGAPAFRTLEHARVWRARGHEVTVVTCVPNHPSGVPFRGYRNVPFQEETKDGIRVIRVGTYMTRNEGIIKRTLDYASFALSCVLQHRRIPDADVILATSPTFFTAIAGWLLSILKGRPWVFELRDLWPASIRAVGVSQSRFLDLVERFELFLYRDATRVLSVTHSFRDELVRRGIDRDKIDVVTNGVDTKEFSPEFAPFDARTALGVPPGVVLAGYIGTIGMAHGLEAVVEAAALTRSRTDIRYVIIGEGAERLRIEELALRRAPTNLTVSGFVPHDRVPSYLAALDISIVHLKADPVFRSVIPSKIFESMAMGRPLVMGVEGESAEIVREADAGICVPSGSGDAIAQAVVSLADRPGERRRLGRNGRKAAVLHFGREPLAIDALESLFRAVKSADRP
jgi:putative colanic acid biosynthesis glycosyltransferase WcaI